MTNVSTTVKIVVSMVVVAALVATRFSSSKSSVGLKAARGLKGTRKLQTTFGGIVLANSVGQSDSGSAINIGILEADPALPGGTGNSFGNGDAVGTSKGFASSALGAATATGTSGGNSTASSILTVLSDTAAMMGMGKSNGLITSLGSGGGAAGGNAVFGPSLSAAIAAATPADAPPAPEPVEVDSKGGSSGDQADIPTAPMAPPFQFVQGLPTGGGGGGFGNGSGITGGSIASPDGAGYFADEAYGSALANGFGFGVGSGVAVNNGGEQAGGQGGGTALGQGQFTFELDDVSTATFANQGATKSLGGAGAFVGFDAPPPSVFTNFITNPPAP